MLHIIPPFLFSLHTVKKCHVLLWVLTCVDPSRSQKQWDQVYEDLTQALEHHTQAIAATTDPDKRKMMLAEVEKVCSYGRCNI